MENLRFLGDLFQPPYKDQKDPISFPVLEPEALFLKFPTSDNTLQSGRKFLI